MKFDAIGVGALNLDYVSAAPALRDAFQQARWGFRLDNGQETWISRKSARRILRERAGDFGPPTVGGSAYNAINSLAQLELGLKLGFVGVAGAGPLSIRAALCAEGISADHVERSRLDAGVCLSSVADLDRRLATSSGANDAFLERLASRKRRASIVAVLGASRLVHVSSIRRGLGLTAELLREARAAHPHLIVTVDPGLMWATKHPDRLRELLWPADVVFANPREFRAMAGAGNEASIDRDLAEDLYARLGLSAQLVVAKGSAGETTIFEQPAGAAVREKEFRPRYEPLVGSEVVDDTGAGDIFASAVLASLVSRDVQLATGVRHGVSLARRRMRNPIENRFDGFPAHGTRMRQSVVPFADSGDRRSVMIVCGRDQVVNRAVFDTVRTLGLNPMEWPAVRNRAQGRVPFVGEAVERGIRHAQAVLVIISPEDHARMRAKVFGKKTPLDKNQRSQARPNVWFEAGYAMACKPDQTFMVEVGRQDMATDLVGRHGTRIEGREGVPSAVQDISDRLEESGCPASSPAAVRAAVHHWSRIQWARYA